MKRTQIASRGPNWKRKKATNRRIKREKMRGLAVKVMPDGKERCLDNDAGRREYALRRNAMAERQNWICGCGCGNRMVSYPGSVFSVTFEHVDGRGAGRRDDRIEIDGTPYNKAFSWSCNIRAGSPQRRKEGVN